MVSDHMPYRPSNGIEGQAFCDKWCGKCKADHIDDPCKILGDTFIFQIDDPEYPREWREDGASGPRCTAFDPIDEADQPIDPGAVVRELL